MDPKEPFSAAFRESEGWGWVRKVIGVGASFGILTSLVVAMLGQARYLCVIGRSSVVPTWLARVHPRTATPVNASAFLGVITAGIALFTDLQVLLKLVSIGTLFVFYMVANAVVYRRYVTAGTTSPWPTAAFLITFSSLALAFTLLWKLASPGIAKVVLLGACTAGGVAAVQLFRHLVPEVRKPEIWGVPLMPWVPAMSIFLNLFLLGSLDGPSYLRFAIFSAAVVMFYALYSVHASFDAEEKGELCVKDDRGSVKPLEGVSV